MSGISRLLAGLLLISALSACSPQVQLNDQTFDRYIRAVYNLQRTYPDLARKLQTQGESSLNAQDVEKVENAVRTAGFNDLREFVEVNQAVAWSVTKLKTQHTIQNQDLNISKGLQQFSDDLGRIQAQSKNWWSEFSHQFSQPADQSGVSVVERNLQKLKDIWG